MSTSRTLGQLEVLQLLGVVAGSVARLGLVDAYPHYKVTLHACGFFATWPASLVLNGCLGLVELPMRFGAPPEITVLRLLARPAR